MTSTLLQPILLTAALKAWKLGREASNSPWELESIVKLKHKSGIQIYVDTATLINVLRPSGDLRRLY